MRRKVELKCKAGRGSKISKRTKGELVEGRRVEMEVDEEEEVVQGVEVDVVNLEVVEAGASRVRGLSWPFMWANLSIHVLPMLTALVCPT